MRPAIVTLRVPDRRDGSLDVRLPLWRPVCPRTQARVRLADDELLTECLRLAHAAHAAGNPAASLVAVRLLRARPDRAWPPWLVAGVLGTLETTARPGIGRHGDPWRRWHDDAADYLRYRALELLSGADPWGVYGRVRVRLRLEAGEQAAVEDRALRRAYQRVVARTVAPDPPTLLRYAPRYYPDLASLHLLHAADRHPVTNPPL
jgi:hypothetical protein